VDHDALAFVLVIYYFGGAVLVGWLADRRGRSVLVYVLGCLVFPIATLPAVLYLLAIARRPEPPDGADGLAPDRLDALERLNQLHATGALTDDELSAEKKRLLSA
jgi:hypothetical protein